MGLYLSVRHNMCHFCLLFTNIISRIIALSADETSILRPVTQNAVHAELRQRKLCHIPRPSNERNSRCTPAAGCPDQAKIASLIIIGVFAATLTKTPATDAHKSSCPPGG